MQYRPILSCEEGNAPSPIMPQNKFDLIMGYNTPDGGPTA